MPQDPVETARRLAEEVLLPDAAAVDGAERIPDAHLAALDAAGLTGLAAAGADLATRFDVTAALAGGCLATAFVWLQHQGALAATAAAEGPVADLVPELASGRLRAGLAITAVRGPDPLRLLRAGARLVLTGSAPWVTGWGTVDVLRVAAIDDDGRVTTALVDVGERMHAEPTRLVAANASATVTLAFDDVVVPEDRLLDSVSPEAWARADAAGLAINGALALGVAARAADWIGSASLAEGIRLAREHVCTVDPAVLPSARAGCSTTALVAAGALAAHDGSRGLLAGSRADRLLREAHFLLAFGSRPAIREDVLQRLHA